MTKWDGHPLNPERDGEHVFLEGSVKVIRTWHALGATWWYPGAAYHIPAADAAKFAWQYLGPYITPAEVAAREAAAAAAEREACIEALDKECRAAQVIADCGAGWLNFLNGMNYAMESIRARGRETKA